MATLHLKTRPRLPSRLAGLRQRFPSRGTLRLYMAALGPGLISALAGNDAGGIGTYSYAGANYGFQMLFLLVVITFVLALVQEMSARMGAVTQKGLGELIREQYGVSWTLFALGVMLVANTATVVAEFAGVSAAGTLFGIPPYVSIPVAAITMWLLVTRGPFRLVERIFLAICLIQVTYVVAAIKAVNENKMLSWEQVLRQTAVPHFSGDTAFLLLMVGVVGTTIAPWMQFFLQSNMVDRGVRIAQYRYQKADVYLGAFVTDLVAWFIIVCTAATLYPLVQKGLVLEDTTQIAQALSIPLGSIGTVLFAAGLLAASLLAAAVLPLATAYTWCEAFGWEIGLEKTSKQAPLFYGIFTVTLFLGAAIMLIPGVNPLSAMLISQDLNGILLPVVLIFMLKLVNDKRLMKDYTNGFWGNLVAWTMVTILIALTVVLVVTSVLGVG